MQNEDKKAFLNAMNALSEYYQRKDPLSDMALMIYFNALSAYSIEEVKYSIGKHVQSPSGTFYPKASDLVKLIDVQEVSSSDIIAAARNPKTPLGVLARVRIGKFDLDHQNEFYLKDRAAEVQALIPEWKEKSKSGRYTSGELVAFKRFEVNPERGFVDGMPPVKLPGIGQKMIEAQEKQERRIAGNESRLLSHNPEGEDQ